MNAAPSAVEHRTKVAVRIVTGSVGLTSYSCDSPVNRRVGIHDFTSRPAQASLALRPARSLARPEADFCPEASTWPVTRPSRSVATTSYRQLHGWILLPLVILRRSGAPLTTGWACSSGSPDESAKPTAQLPALQAKSNRVRAIAFVSQDYRCTDSRGVASIRVRTIGVEKKVVLARRHVNWRAELPIRPGTRMNRPTL
jgi:hypothetical protein